METMLAPTFTEPHLRIGSVTLPHRALMAPMVNYNESPLRRLALRHGSGWATTEMLKVEQFLAGERRLERILARSPIERPFALQLAGREPAELLEAGLRAQALGFEILDLNMGCPTRKEVARRRGVYLMREPKTVQAIVATLVRGLSIPVTVKLRSGWSAEETCAPDIARIAAQEGAAAVCVHGRSKLDWYRGDSRLEVIARVREVVSCPLIGNGSVDGVAAALRMVRQTGCDAVMIGRAAIGNPWIFARINAALEEGRILPPPGPSERAAGLIEHLDLLVDWEGEEPGVRTMRGYLFPQFRDFPDRERIFTALRAARTRDGLAACVAEAFSA